MDDRLMSVVFDDNIEATELFVRIVINNSKLKVQSAKTQYVVSNETGHSVKLDIFAKDSSGKKYNIEVQKLSDQADIKRARFNTAMIDINSLLAGEKYSSLTDTYVIFLTEQDYFSLGLPLYSIDTYINETKQLYSTGVHIIYVMMF